jgi:hypothetical protein
VDRAELLAAYDRELRRNAPYFDDQVRLERDGTVVRLLGATADAGNNCVLFADLTENDAENVVDRQIDYFRGLGRDFEWKLHEHDRPASLRSVLLSRGFVSGGEETIVARSLAATLPSPDLPAGYRAGPWPDSDGLAGLFDVQNRVWPDEDLTWLTDSLTRERATAPHSIRFHAVWHEDRPVCVGWTRLHGRFASLFGGSTLIEHRGKGLYRALLSSRLEEAARLGADHALVDAGPMSRPILERQGFSPLTGTTPMILRLKPA